MLQHTKWKNQDPKKVVKKKSFKKWFYKMIIKELTIGGDKQ